jgi:hypothetical protein
MCVNVGAGRYSDSPFLLYTSQHDPDDEPVAPPLDPEFFEFDCGCLFDDVRDVY